MTFFRTFLAVSSAAFTRVPRTYPVIPVAMIMIQTTGFGMDGSLRSSVFGEKGLSGGVFDRDAVEFGSLVGVAFVR
ncbi:hypothetical protein [Herbiconiux sp. VKM Ac-2851]|uniref:hypothetical protein n=1 Tax=Herbiconiux sp. VKM Ac-2851 TaxID=2739025 RepID=UPI001564C49D|nr:hypothetical protein [Herbiconiux sp. VKM Ac-2851]NQX37140.1 hypothetical protein [Herbiconiux sp. VKM Ac-2851]